MERIQLVNEALNTIMYENYPFFTETNTHIIQYVDIIPNGNKDWLNVTYKEDSALPHEVKEQIEKRFKIYQ